MADSIIIAKKEIGDTLTADELNSIVKGTNAAITEQNETKTSHAESIAANALAIASEAESRATADAGKVDKVTGKGLSTEDYTTEEKQKLAGLSDNDKGFFANEAAIIATYETGQAGWFVRNGETDTIWVWDVEGGAWVDTGNQDSGGSATLLEWVSGEEKPVVECDRQIGDFFEGKIHLVKMIAVGGETVAVVEVENYESGTFSKPVLDGDVCCCAQMISSYGILIGGAFTGKIKMIDLTGAVDQTFTAPELDGTVEKIIVYNNGTNDLILIAGQFTGNVKRLNADGSVDTTFDATGSVRNQSYLGGWCKIFIDGNYKIYLGYNPGESYSTGVKYLIRLNTDGSNDDTFNVTENLYEGVCSYVLGTTGLYVSPNWSPAQIIKLDFTGAKIADFSNVFDTVFPNCAGDPMMLPHYSGDGFLFTYGKLFAHAQSDGSAGETNNVVFNGTYSYAKEYLELTMFHVLKFDYVDRLFIAGTFAGHLIRFHHNPVRFDTSFRPVIFDKYDDETNYIMDVCTVYDIENNPFVLAVGAGLYKINLFDSVGNSMEVKTKSWISDLNDEILRLKYTSNLLPNLSYK